MAGKPLHPQLLHRWGSISNRTPTPVIDEEGYIVAMLVGQPKSTPNSSKKIYCKVIEEATHLFDQLQCKLPSLYSVTASLSKGRLPRRGLFHAATTGISFGGGQQVSLMLFFQFLLNPKGISTPKALPCPKFISQL
jgi:hypothetical protein